MDKVTFEHLYIAKEQDKDNDYLIRYVKGKENGTYYTYSKENIIMNTLMGPRVFKTSGEYGIDFISGIIDTINNGSIDIAPNINVDDVINVLEENILEIN